MIKTIHYRIILIISLICFQTYYTIGQSAEVVEEKDFDKYNNTKIILPRFLMGLEIGFGDFDGEMNDEWVVRQDVGGYESDGVLSNNNIYSDLYHFQVGVKAEYSFFKSRLSILSGLRFKQLNGEIGNSSDNNYFLLKYKQTENATEFLRVKEINESTSYVSIPLEIKVMPFRLFNKFGVYARAGIEYAFLISDDSSIDFYSDEMDQYEDDVYESLISEDLNSSYSTFYTTIGLSFFPTSNFIMSIETYIASDVISENNSQLYKPTNYKGVNFHFQIPLFKPKK